MKIIKINLKYIIIAIGIIFVWRGIWGLADIYIFPESPALSFIASIITGIIILLLIDTDKKDNDLGELI